MREVRVKKPETIILTIILVCVFGLVFRAQLAHSLANGQSVTPYIVDDDPPVIEIPSQQPPVDTVAPGQDVIVWVNVTDALSGVKNVTLSYTTNNGANLETLVMFLNETVGFYETMIPSQRTETIVKYVVTAFDWAENNATLNITWQCCTYVVTPELSTMAFLPFFMVISAIVIAFARKKTVSQL